MKQKKLNKSLLSIDHDDDQDGYDEFDEFLKEHTNRTKNKDANEIYQMGETYLEEIEYKKSIQEKEKKPLINYIISKTNKYSEKYLYELDIKDVKEIHSEVKIENRTFIKKVIDWLFF